MVDEEVKEGFRRMSWEEILADEEYGRRFQEEVNKRQNLERQQGARQRLAQLRREAEELGFDLDREMENRDFVRLTAPGSGLSLEEAYYAVHRKELGEDLARQSMISAGESIRSGYGRPRELRSEQRGSSQVMDPRSMTKQQREELKQRIYAAKARGEKLPYGG